MLTVTPAASTAVAAVLDSPQVPDGAGLRLQAGVDAAGQSAIGIAVVDQPDAADEHIPVEAGRELLVAADVATALDGQVLDAEIQDDSVAFTIRPPSVDGEPPVDGGPPGA